VGLCPRRSGSGAELGARWCPQEILMLPDGSDAHMRRLRYTGPGAVLVTVAHERIESPGHLAGRPRLTLREHPHRRLAAGGQVIVLAAGMRLRVQ
jgi:hypothetical protein